MLTTAKPIAPSKIFFISSLQLFSASIGPEAFFSDQIASAHPPNFCSKYIRFTHQYRLPNATGDEEVRVPEVNDLQRLLPVARGNREGLPIEIPLNRGLPPGTLEQNWNRRDRVAICVDSPEQTGVAK